MDELLSEKFDEVSFAWAGSYQEGRGHYYMVRGPQFVLEYDKVQDAANHVHAVWRKYTGDWGEDLLAAHYGVPTDYTHSSYIHMGESHWGYVYDDELAGSHLGNQLATEAADGHRAGH